MNRCEDFQSSLTWWLDGELEEQLQGDLRQHLRTCQTCQEALENQQRERLWLKENDRELVPGPELWQKIRRRLQEETANRQPGMAERLWSLLFPQPLHQMTRVWVGVSLMALMAVSSLLLIKPSTVGPSADMEVRQLMENYVQWRQDQKPFELPGVNLPASSIEELRLANPFLDEKNGNADSNPFEI